MRKLKQIIEETKDFFRAIETLGRNQELIYLDILKTKESKGDYHSLIRKHQIGAYLWSLAQTQLIVLRTKAVVMFEIHGREGLSEDEIQLLTEWANPAGEVVVSGGLLKIKRDDISKIVEGKINSLSKEQCEVWLKATQRK